MCRPDTTVEVKDERAGGVTGFGTEHVCWDWRGLVEWTGAWEGWDGGEGVPGGGGTVGGNGEHRGHGHGG